MSADTLFWGDATPSAHEIESDALADLQRGDFVRALLLEERGHAEEPLFAAMDTVARKVENRLLLVAQAVGLQQAYSDQVAVAVNTDKTATLHVLAEASSCSEVVRSDEKTACGQQLGQMFSAFRGSFSRLPKGATLCPDCAKSTRAAEALSEEVAALSGLHRHRVIEELASRLQSRKNISQHLVEQAIMAAMIREGSLLLAKKALDKGDGFLLDAWGEELQAALVKKNPDYKKALTLSSLRGFFARRTLGSFTAMNTRAALYNLALDGASPY